MAQLYDNKTKTVFNWSSGKDAAYGFYMLAQQQQYDITHLLTTINAEKGKVVMHGVREELLDMQAERIGLLLKKIYLPASLEDTLYKNAMSDALQELKDAGVSAAAYGDIFLEDLKTYREQQLSQVGIEAVFPLWGANTRNMVQAIEHAGVEAVIVCVNGKVLDKTFLGRKIDTELLNDLPAGVDPCGENGEFHTFVYNAPYFSTGIPYRAGEVVKTSYHDPVNAGGNIEFYFLDVLPDV